MNLDQLLVLFQVLEDKRVEYAVVGDLAAAMQGQVALTECFDIWIEPRYEHVVSAREAIASAWPSAQFVELDGVAFRVLPRGTPFYLAVRTQHIDGVITVKLRAVAVRLVPDSAHTSSLRFAGYSRPGFTLRERLAALHSLSSEIVPRRRVFRGVWKYRSIEDAKADRAVEPHRT